jgi:tRNA 2-selenouridine synthase
MSRPVKLTSEPEFEKYSEIIDVRSPDEFAEDHVPGAINCYVLNNEERATVGTIYKQQSPFTARKLGASLISANIARWTKDYFIDKTREYTPLVYCWRGGQRSMSLATILSRIGWDTSLIEGGYKQYRKQVIRSIEAISPKLDLIIISGLTGTAKTDLLKLLQKNGEQMIDLEGLANHRGSLLGPDPEKHQPSQIYFESLLAKALKQFDPVKRVWVEAESNKIGNLYCPAPFWMKMAKAKVIELRAPINQRVNYLLSEYQFFTENPQQLKDKVRVLKYRHGKQQVADWNTMIDNNDWHEFVKSLLNIHYDPAYQSSANKNQRQKIATIELSSLDQTGLQNAVNILTT